jgi:hypothetical protein
MTKPFSGQPTESSAPSPKKFTKAELKQQKSLDKLLQTKQHRQAQKSLWIKIGVSAIGVAILVGALVLVERNKSHITTKPGTQYAIVSRVHIPEGSPRPTNYNSNPPSSGPHYPTPANWGVYTVEQPDQRLVHNLEHGGIWISYKDPSDTKLVAELTKLAQQFQTKVILEPRAENPAPISLVSWGWVENLQTFDQQKIIDFYNAHKDQGPEFFPDVPGDFSMTANP